MPLKIPQGFVALQQNLVDYHTLVKGDVMYGVMNYDEYHYETVQDWAGSLFGKKKGFRYQGVLIPAGNLMDSIKICVRTATRADARLPQAQVRLPQAQVVKPIKKLVKENEDIPNPPVGYSVINVDENEYQMKDGDVCYLRGYGWRVKSGFYGYSIAGVRKEMGVRVSALATLSQNLPPRFKCEKPYPFGY